MSDGKYALIRVVDQPGQGKRFDADGLRQKCEDTPVFEPTHSSGRKLRVCEYHIQVYWNAWPTFRVAARDIWPVKQPT